MGCDNFSHLLFTCLIVMIVSSVTGRGYVGETLLYAPICWGQKSRVWFGFVSEVHRHSELHSVQMTAVVVQLIYWM